MFEVELKGKDSTGLPTTVRTDGDGNLLGEISGDVAADAADSGNPLKVGGVARTTNPTAVADGDRVSASFDDLGRQLTTPYQVRDLVSTALAQTATLAEVTLISGVASTYLDLMSLTCANTTGVAVGLDIRDTTGGSAVETVQLAANETKVINYTVPKKQNDLAATWTIINRGTGDISNTNIVVSANFIRNI